MALNMRAYGDFVEGVRAQIVEKDRNPKWKYADLKDVDPKVVVSILDQRGNNGPEF